MNTPARTAALILFAGALSGWSQPSPSPGAHPSVSEVAAGFTKFQQLTKVAVFVNPELAMLCRGATKEEVAAARVKFGPHANTGILIYMNEVAADAFTRNASAFPVGAAIVKQKTGLGYTGKDGKPVREAERGVGGMVKRPAGYDPENGDWEYFYFEDAAKIESGRISTCVQCHSGAKDNDYVFGTWRRTGG
jgi:hypothetical protein